MRLPTVRRPVRSLVWEDPKPMLFFLTIDLSALELNKIGVKWRVFCIWLPLLNLTFWGFVYIVAWISSCPFFTVNSNPLFGLLNKKIHQAFKVRAP